MFVARTIESLVCFRLAWCGVAWPGLFWPDLFLFGPDSVASIVCSSYSLADWAMSLAVFLPFFFCFAVIVL